MRKLPLKMLHVDIKCITMYAYPSHFNERVIICNLNITVTLWLKEKKANFPISVISFKEIQSGV
jgi:hypothetical protein